jgi:hypothetical protein
LGWWSKTSRYKKDQSGKGFVHVEKQAKNLKNLLKISARGSLAEIFILGEPKS